MMKKEKTNRPTIWWSNY